MLIDSRLPKWLRRPWPPNFGFGFGCCGCTGCTPACTPTFAPVGTVGSDTGSKCTDCGTTVINDGFGSTLDSAWVVGGSGCAGTIGSLSTQYHTSGGQLLAGSSGNIMRPFSRPALAGFCVEIKATIATFPGSGSGAAGIVLGYGRSFFARKSFSNYGRQSKIDAGTCVLAGGDFQSFGPSPADGDVLSMIFRDAGSADGICTICYKVNGTTVRVEDGVQCCFDCTMYAGIVVSYAGVVFDDFQVLTS